MSTTAAGVIFILSLIVALAVAYRYLGDYMYRVVTGTKHSRVERGVYRAIGVNPPGEQTWGTYARSLLAFSAVSLLFLYAMLRLQDKLGWVVAGSSKAGDRPHRLEHRGQLHDQHELAGVLG